MRQTDVVECRIGYAEYVRNVQIVQKGRRGTIAQAFTRTARKHIMPYLAQSARVLRHLQLLRRPPCRHEYAIPVQCKFETRRAESTPFTIPLENNPHLL